MRSTKLDKIRGIIQCPWLDCGCKALLSCKFDGRRKIAHGRGHHVKHAVACMSLVYDEKISQPQYYHAITNEELAKGLSTYLEKMNATNKP